MKNVLCSLLTILVFSVNAQIEITNLDTVFINDVDSPQNIKFDVMNISSESVDVDWEVEFANDSDSFLSIAVADINMDYTPQIHTSCDLQGVTNVLLAFTQHEMRLHINLDEVPDTFDKKATLGYFNLYIAGECDGDKLLSIPIMFDNITSSSVENNNKYAIQLYPNPARNLIFVDTPSTNNPVNYKIYDLKLKKYKNGMLINQAIDISMLPNGQYILEVDNQNILFVKN